MSFFGRVSILMTGMAYATIFSGCYKDDVFIEEEFPAKLITGDDSSVIIFFHYLQVSKPAAGLYAFPDGGISKKLYYHLGLWLGSEGKDGIQKIMDYNRPPLGPGRWTFDLVSSGKRAAFCIAPIAGWDWEAERNPSVAEYRKSFGGIFTCDVSGQEILRISESGYSPFFIPGTSNLLFVVQDSDSCKIYQAENGRVIPEPVANLALASKARISDYRQGVITLSNNKGSGYQYDTNSGQVKDSVTIRKKTEPATFPEWALKYLANRSLADWGFSLKNIGVHPGRKLESQIVGLKGNLAFRRAALLDIYYACGNSCLNKILAAMDERQNKLSGYKRTEYELYSAETRKWIEQLLNKTEK